MNKYSNYDQKNISFVLIVFINQIFDVKFFRKLLFYTQIVFRWFIDLGVIDLFTFIIINYRYKVLVSKL